MAAQTQPVDDWQDVTTPPAANDDWEDVEQPKAARAAPKPGALDSYGEVEPKFLARRKPPPEPTGLRRYALEARDALLTGASRTIGLAGDALSAPIVPVAGEGPGEGNIAFRSPKSLLSPSASTLLPPTTQEIFEQTDPGGYTHRGDITPSDNEKSVSQFLEGVGSAAPLLALGGGSPALTLATGGAGELAARKAEEAFPGSKLAPFVAGAAAGGGVALARRVLGGPEVERLARSLGSSQSYEDAGIELKDSAQGWRDEVLGTKSSPGVIDGLWKPINVALAGKPTPLTHFEQTLSDITASGGQLSTLSDILTPTLAKRLEAKYGGTAAGLLGLPAPWEDVQRIRSLLGKATQKTRDEIGQENLDRLYGSISEDMKDTAHANGVGDAFEQANDESTRLYGLNKGPIARVLDTEKPGKTAKALLQESLTDSTDLRALRDEIPEGVDELAAAHVRLSSKEWNRLPQGSKEALVPDVYRRGRLDAHSQTTAELLHKYGPGAVAAEFAGGALGGIAEYLWHGLGGAPEAGALTLGGDIGVLTGLALPPALAAGKAIVRNPSVLRLPSAGALGAFSATPEGGSQ